MAAILQVVATHELGLIYAGRAIGGFSVGIITTVCPVYLAEVSPPAIRGRLVGFCTCFLFTYHKIPDKLPLDEIAYQISAVVGFCECSYLMSNAFLSPCLGINYGIKETIGELSDSSWRIPFAIQLIPGGLLLIGIVSEPSTWQILF